MRLARLICFLILALTAYPAFGEHHEEGFYSLFDGKTLDNWDGNPKFWSVTEGALTGITTKENPTAGNTFLIWRGGKVEDFELRLKFKIVGGNSGIQYRSEDKGNWVVGGYQGDFEAGDTYSGILYEEKGRGILAQRGQVTRVRAGEKPKVEVVATVGESSDIQRAIKKEDWNDYKIIANGNRLMHIINDRMTCQVIDLDMKRAATSGVLALQLHAGPPMKVQFKDVRLKPLNGANIAGTWKFVVKTDAGTGEPTFKFDSDGEKLTGSYSGLLGEIDTVTGRIQGSKVSWMVEGTYNGQELTGVYEGKITGLNQMQGTLTINEEFDAEWTATRAD